MPRRSKNSDERLVRAIVALVGMVFVWVVFFPKVVEKAFWWGLGVLSLVAVIVFGLVALKALRKDSRTPPGEARPGPGVGGDILKRWLDENRPDLEGAGKSADRGEQRRFSSPERSDNSRPVYRNPSGRSAPAEAAGGAVAGSQSVDRTCSGAEEVRLALRALDWFQFEKLVTVYYRAQGFAVRRVGGAQPDGGVDLILEHEGQRYVIQCKHWKRWTVGVRQMREFLGTLTDTGIANGIYITTRGYTDEARDFASKHSIQLFEEAQLVQCILDMGATERQVVGELLADRRKFCPRCESEMVLRTARKGANAGNEFWGCSRYPRCKYILNTEEKE